MSLAVDLTAVRPGVVDRLLGRSDRPVPDEAACRADLIARHQADIDALARLGCEVSVEFGVLSYHY